MSPAITADRLGAWLLKATPAGLRADGHADRLEGITSRCVRPSYRTGLVRPGQPVLLWVSGRDPQLPRGIHAAGRTTGEVDVDRDGSVSVPVALHEVSPPVLADGLLAHPVLRAIEVLTMPAGSNPSFLDVEQYAALVDAHPQLSR